MYLLQQDLITGFICLLLIAMALLFIEVFIKRNWISKKIGRKCLHIIAISTCGYCIATFKDRYLLALLFSIFFFLLLFVVHKKWLQINESTTYGIALFPLSFAVLLYCPFIPINNIVFAALCLAICDAMAGLAGERFGSEKIFFLGEGKTLVGFITFLLSCTMLAVVFFQVYSIEGLVGVFLLAFIVALTELFSIKGSDNFSIPIIAALASLLIQYITAQELLELILLNLFLILGCLVVVKRKWLTFSGAVAGLWMAQLIFVAGGFKGFYIPLFFLITGSLLSKIYKQPKETNGRNAIQVFSNGLVGVIFLVAFKLSSESVFLYCSLVSFCISMADTCSSEIGQFFKQQTLDVITFKKVPAGLSGGVSIAGTLGGLLGAILIATLSYLVWSLHFTMVLFCIIFGFLGMLLDSVLGSVLQAKYTTEDNQLIDYNISTAKKVKGYYWCTNDVVNILSNAIATLFFYLVFELM
jgi:uncharacterized protein (TIGR00297 family)